MKKTFRNKRRGLVFTAIVVLLLMVWITFMPRNPVRTQTVKEIAFNHTGADGVTRSYNPNIPNYDIRKDESEEAGNILTEAQQKSGKASMDLMFVKQEMLNGEAELRRRVPTLKVEYNQDLRVPEVIGTDVLTETVLAKTNIPAGKKHAEAVRDFLQRNESLFGLRDEQIRNLKVIADYTNPDGVFSYVDLGQEIDGIPVFKGEVRAGITKDGEVFRMINNLAPGLEYPSLSKHFGRAEDAVFAAAKHINRQAASEDVITISTKNNGQKVEFERGQFADPTTAEKMYFPTEPGVAVPAWCVLMWEPVAAYYVIVDAETGKLLWRKNITDDQTQSATYNVYDDENPAPSSPTTALPGANFQAPLINRTSFTLIGNEAPNTFNNLGWINDGNNTTDGNNAEAGLDLTAPDGVDVPLTGSSFRIFDFAYNPAPGNPGPGDAPTTPNFRNGMVTNMFYWANKYHDSLYNAGFTEQARNFQNDNFGRGGVAGDRLRAEGQDFSGFNNANMSTPADGGRGRSQMFIFNGPNPDRDSGLDMDVFLHELTHGTSNRLIGNAFGLTDTRGRGMGEGWSDFYARVIPSNAGEDVNGIYTNGGWITLNIGGGSFTNNYYFGIRRFPYAVKTNVGANGKPHNPITFADIDPTKINLTDGAFPSAFVGSATQVHNEGEVWCMALLEVRARLITRLGFAAGNQRVLQLVTDGMKLTPTNPSFIDARDAILAAAQALGGSDTSDIWVGFTARGMGFGATDNITTFVVVESFALPNLLQTPTFSFTDANNNGFVEPGEALVLTVPIQNPRSDLANNVTVSVNGGTAVSYGNIAGNQTVTSQINYTVPANQACGSNLTLNFAISSSLGPTTAQRAITVGAPQVSFSQNFDGVAAPALPAGYTTAITGAGTAWVTSVATPDTGANSVFTSDPAAVSSSELVTPAIPISTSAAKLTFRNNYDTDPGFDGGVLEISIPSVSAGAFQDILIAGGSFASGGYQRALNNSANPLAGRLAWSGSSGGYITTSVNLPAAANGQNIRLKFRAGSDAIVGRAGWNVDTISVFGVYTCGTAGIPSLLINDVSVNEGNGGTTTATFTVSLSSPAPAGGVTFNIATQDGTATTANNDYLARSLTNQTIQQGQSSYTFNVTINGDTAVELTETFFVNLSNAANATIADNQGLGTIVNDDAAGCAYSINPTSQNFSASGGTGIVNVTTQNGCAWTAASNSSNTIGNVSLFSLSSGFDLLSLPYTAFGKSLPLTVSNGSTGSPYAEKTNFPATETGAIPNSNMVLTPAFTEGFDDITTLSGRGWFTQNNSTPPGTTGWYQGSPTPTTFPAQAGPANSYIAANFNNSTGSNTISNWLLTPTIEYRNGDVITFYTRTEPNATFADRLQVRLSTNGSGTNVGTGPTGVGDFTRLLLDINPAYVAGTTGGYPVVWTQFTITISGLSGATNGRLAFRYFVENGGPSGANGSYIGIDTFAYTPATASNWITINPPGSGNGNGSVTYQVAPNTTGQPRPGTMTIAGQTFTVNQSNTQIPRTAFDFDGDGKTDISIFRPAPGQWWYLRSSDGGNRAFQFGASTDKLVPADYTGDGKTDIAFFRPSSNEWFVLRSEDNSFYAFPFGAAGDVPAPADYDGDGKADPAVFRPSTTTWFINRSSGGTIIQQFGALGDVPAVADYDGDGKADIAIYRPGLGQWWLSRSTAGVIAFQFGTTTDKPVQGDYTGDGKADVAFWRPASGEWFVLRSEDNSFYAFPFGTTGDIPSPGDYDGDGKFDAAIFRPSNVTWFVQRTSSGTLIQGFGQSGDISVPNAFVP